MAAKLRYMELEYKLSDVEKKSQDAGWIPPRCPDCFGVLSQYCMVKNKLICLKCGAVLEMTVVAKEPI